MLRYRLISGTILAAAMAGVLFADAHLAPVFPFLIGCAVCVAVVATGELIGLLPAGYRPGRVGSTLGVLAVLLSNWIGPFAGEKIAVWPPVLFAFAAVLLTAFLVEMRRYTKPGTATLRLALFGLIVCYLGLLPSFLMQLRWRPIEPGLALAAVIFVPKCGDIGAYFTGRAIGRTPFSPVLSPKKTWEGIAGGMTLATLTAVAFSALGPVFPHGLGQAVAFGLMVGAAGIAGDLAESMLKRDALAKDAAASVPGFGGVLDVIDAVLFAAPVGYAVLAV